MGIFVRRAAFSAIALHMLGTAPLMAQNPADKADQGLSDIIVTAQKREQRLVDVPFSISAYDSARLSTLSARELDKVAAITPGLVIQLQDKFSPGIVIRGVTSDDSSPFAEQRVAVFQDGIAASQTTASYGELFDVDRVEVEKGPQSTLHGRSALNGGISIFQNRAKAAFGFAGLAAYGNRDYLQLEGVLNVPVASTLALRFGARLRKRDGFVKDSDGQGSYNALNAKAFRAAVAWTPVETFRFDLIALYDRDDTKGGVPFKSGTFVPRDVQTGAVTGDARFWTPTHLTTFGDIASPFFTRDIVNVSGIASWILDDHFSLTSTSGYRWSRAAQSGDNDGFATNIIEYYQRNGGEQYSQELRLNISNLGILDGFLGASWLDSKARMQLDQAFDERALSLLLNGTLQGLAPAGLTNAEINQRLGASAANFKPFHLDRQFTLGDVKSYDIFADGTAHLTQKLDLFAGGRISWTDKTTGIQGVLPTGPSKITGGAIFLASTPGQALLKRANESHDATWRLGARYALGRDANLYLVYGVGRRPEILQPRASGIFTLAPAEKLRAIEGGVKVSALGGRFSGDTSVYHYEYSNFQTRGFVGGVLSTINAGKADSTGFEAQGTLLVASGTTIFASYGYNKARLRSGLYAGNRFRNSPDHKFAVGGEVRAPLLNGTVSFAPMYSWQSKMFFNDDNDRPELQIRSPAAFSDRKVDETQKPFGLLGAKLSFTPAGQPWSISVVGENLTDAKFIADAGNGGDNFGIPTFIGGTRRSVMGQIELKF